LKAALQFLGVENGPSWQEANRDGWTIGSVESLLERLAEYERVGTTHAVLMLAPGDDFEMLELVAKAAGNVQP
jgi:hypothetical protein